MRRAPWGGLEATVWAALGARTSGRHRRIMPVSRDVPERWPRRRFSPRVRRMSRRSASFALIPVATLVLAVVGAAEPPRVVLGSKASFRYGSGWGTAHPSALDNDGDPSGRAWSIDWTRWGGTRALGRGMTYLAPSLTRNYWRKGRVQLRASRIGRCTVGGVHAYTRLDVRVAELHSGRFSAWQLWNGRPNLCKPNR